MRVVVSLSVVLALWAGVAGAVEFGPPVNLGVPVNTVYGEAGTAISSDGQMLILCCDAYSGLGLLDLYMSTGTGIGWSNPVNLGPNVNTESSENKPELSSDGLTLYFRSDRDGGMGGFDIYVAEGTGTEWGAAHPIDGGVNTADHEVAISLSADGLQRYVAAIRPAHPGLCRVILVGVGWKSMDTARASAGPGDADRRPRR